MSSARFSGVAISILTSAVPAFSQCEPVWSSLGGHDGYGGESLVVHDEDGTGPLPPSLFVGGGGLGPVTTIARWDGWDVSSLGGPHEHFYGLYDFEIIAESTGMLPAGLYTGGDITLAGGVSVKHLARWAHGAWHDVGGGVTRPPGLATFVWALQVFDEDGEGPEPPALFVGGQFEFAGSVPVDGFAKWDGREWSEVGGGLRDRIGPGRVNLNAMTVYDDGRGPALYVGGSFDFAGGEEVHNIARWDGSEWEILAPGLNGTVDSLCVFDEDGPGPKRPALFAGGSFNTVIGGEVGALRRIARWDGNEWTPVGGWRSSGAIKAMTVWDEDGPGPKKESLYAGGLMNILPDGSPANGIVRWDGEQWHDVGGGVSGFGVGTLVNAFAAFDEDGPGPNPGGLYVGGLFYRAGGVESKHIARWGCPLPPTPCYADCDGDGELAFFDFLCFQNQFAAGDPLADCDASGDLDFFDFLCFQNAFAAGCP